LRISGSILRLAVLVSVALFVTAYTASAYWAAGSVSEWEGRLWWPSTPGGSFYPWPHPPLGVQGMMASQLSELDSWHFNYVIRSGALLYLIADVGFGWLEGLENG